MKKKKDIKQDNVNLLKRVTVQAILPSIIFSAFLAASIVYVITWLAILLAIVFFIYFFWTSDGDLYKSTFKTRTLVLIPLLYCVIFTFSAMLILDYVNNYNYEHSQIYHNTEHFEYHSTYKDEYFIKTNCSGTYLKSDFDKMDRAIRNNDKSTYDKLLLSSSVRHLHAGDKVEIIENGSHCVKVKTQDGTLLYIHKDFISNKQPAGEYKYHNIDTGEGQNEYGGSREQQRDLDMIDEYARTHPGFM